MEKIVVNNQVELDSIKLDFEGEIIIIGGNVNKPLVLSNLYKNSEVVLSGNAVVEMWGNSQVKEMRENSQVNYMRENSQVKEMWGNSQVNYMRENSQVKEMRENSQVNYMWENSQVNYMRENSQVKEMRENSQVKEMWENSQVKEMWGNSQTKIYSSFNIIKCYGYNYIFVSNEVENVNNIILNETSQILRFDNFKTRQDIDFYLKNFKVKKTEDEKSLIMYKAVHKINEEYVSDYDKNFKYKIGVLFQEECSKDINNSCNVGLHVSDLLFALRFGSDWNDLAILEILVPIDKIVISKDCDGKIRTSELTVLREITKEECDEIL